MVIKKMIMITNKTIVVPAGPSEVGWATTGRAPAPAYSSLGVLV